MIVIEVDDKKRPPVLHIQITSIAQIKVESTQGPLTYCLNLLKPLKISSHLIIKETQGSVLLYQDKNANKECKTEVGCTAWDVDSVGNQNTECCSEYLHQKI